MKKIFAILMALCLMASMICVAAVPASAAGYSVSVCGLSKDGLMWAISINDSFEQAWNEAIYYSTRLEEAWNSSVRYESEADRPAEEGFVRIVIDFYDDWNADSNGSFGSGVGFKDGALYVPNDAKLTVNLGGHSINRGLTENENGDKTMLIDAGADITISNGTIIGNIDADAKAKVALQNVYVAGKTVENSGVSPRAASIFGEGSVATVFSIISLASSAVAVISLIVSKSKQDKKDE